MNSEITVEEIKNNYLLDEIQIYADIMQQIQYMQQSIKGMISKNIATNSMEQALSALEELTVDINHILSSK